MKEVFGLKRISWKAVIFKISLFENVSCLEHLLLATVQVELELLVVVVSLNLRDPRGPLHKFCMLLHDLLLKLALRMSDKNRYAVMNSWLNRSESDPKRSYEKVISHF